VNFNSFEHFAQPGYWLVPVAGPGWLGLAQPIWAGLGAAQNIKKNKDTCKYK